MNESTPKQPEALPWDGQAYSIKRHGVSLTNCDSEPIQTPGCVQSHGALIVADCSNLKILQVSLNCFEILGFAQEELLNADLAHLVGDEQLAVIRRLIQQGNSERNPRFAFNHVTQSNRSEFSRQRNVQAAKPVDWRGHLLVDGTCSQLQAYQSRPKPTRADSFESCCQCSRRYAPGRHTSNCHCQHRIDSQANQ